MSYNRGHPVICSIQAYAQSADVYGDPNANQDGHYVVAIGYDDEHFYFMDPSLTWQRGYLARQEFCQRWHENEGSDDEPEIYQRLGIIIHPQENETPFLRQARHID